jgi:hypothetical protein
MDIACAAYATTLIVAMPATREYSLRLLNRTPLGTLIGRRHRTSRKDAMITLLFFVSDCMFSRQKRTQKYDLLNFRIVRVW